MKEKIYKIFSTVFEIPLNNVNETMSQHTVEQWDSIMHLNLVAEIETELNIVLEPEEIEKMTTLTEVIEVCKSKQ